MSSSNHIVDSMPAGEQNRRRLNKIKQILDILAHCQRLQVLVDNRQRIIDARAEGLREKYAEFENYFLIVPNDPTVRNIDPERPDIDPLMSLESLRAVRRRNIFRHIWDAATVHFNQVFTSDSFGYHCDVCDRLWFSSNLRNVKAAHGGVLERAFGNVRWQDFMVCRTCYDSLDKNKLPALSKTNGFCFPEKPIGLPELNPVAIRLISPRIPFMSLRRLVRDGSLGIIGQVINVPTDVNSMVQQLPRSLEDDHIININIKRKLTHKSSYLVGWVRKCDLRSWLIYLVDQPLYKQHNIQIDWAALESLSSDPNVGNADDDHDDFVENMPNEANENSPLIYRQQSMMFNEEHCIDIAPGQRNKPVCLLFDHNAEELSFPTIYYGQARLFSIPVTPFMIATSEIRRRDRRGASPEHVLYMAMKVLRFRVSNSVYSTFVRCQETENITVEMMKDKDFLEDCVENNLAFLKTIPNSAQYWLSRKHDLFAMIRQLGKPTMFMTLTASEMNWPDLLKTLHRLGDHFKDLDLENNMDGLTRSMRAHLVNEDPVTCCIYFFKLVDTILQMLRSRHKYNPFGRYRVIDSFERYEFQHRGSPHVHILLWLANDPKEPVSEHMPQTVQLVTDLISINNGSGDDDDEYPVGDSFRYQVHKHTFTCYKRNQKSSHKICRFGIPFWPIKETRVLLPMSKDDGRYISYRKSAMGLRTQLESVEYESFDAFCWSNCENYNQYIDIIRSTLDRPTLFIKREYSERMVNSFNPWILSTLQSNMDLQFILDEYSCASYVVDYVNKSNRGMSNLHRELVDLMNKFPDLSQDSLLRKLGSKVLNSIEMSSQEAAWYLLRQNMSHCSRQVTYIPTVLPCSRNKSRKARKDLAELNPGSTDIWTKNIIEKYEERPSNMSELCLADFVSHHRFKSDSRRRRARESDDIIIDSNHDDSSSHVYSKRKCQSIIRYRNYDYHLDPDNFKREMVTLFIPFRNEHVDILDRNKYLDIYQEQLDYIATKRSEYELLSNFQDTLRELQLANASLNGALDDDDINNNDSSTIEQRKRFLLEILSEGEEEDDSDIGRLIGIQNPDDDGQISAAVSRIRTRRNILTKEEYCMAMRTTNFRQRMLILEVIHRLHQSCDRYVADAENEKPLQIFLTGPAGCGKTYVLKLIMETYNRYSKNFDEYKNSYLACASTGKAAINLNGTTVHSAFHLTPSRRVGSLSRETLQKFRSNFRNVNCVIIDEVSMIGNNLLHDINLRLQEATGDLESPFGKMPIIFCGDFRQLPPVKASPVFRLSKNHLRGNMLWQMLDYYNLDQVMRQDDLVFSTILTKIGDGQALTDRESQLIESRFRARTWCDSNLSTGIIRLFHSNSDVDAYNYSVLEGGFDRVAVDEITGYSSSEQLARATAKLHRFSCSDSNGLPYCVKLKVDHPYMVTVNIDVEDGIVNGLIGVLKKYIDLNQLEADDHHGIRMEVDDISDNIEDTNRSDNYCNSVADMNDNELDAIRSSNYVAFMLFDDEKTGAKSRYKVRNLVRKLNSGQQYGLIDESWTPVFDRSGNLTLGGSIKCKRVQLPLSPACAITIHKSQGGTFSKAVIGYDKSLTSQLVYVAISRVRSIDGLFMINDKSDHIFHHKHGRSTPAIKEIRDEYDRLAQHTLNTLTLKALEFINEQSKQVTIATINAQSLVAHSSDISTDGVLSRCKILALTETWMDDTKPIAIDGFEYSCSINNNNSSVVPASDPHMRTKSTDGDSCHNSRLAGGVALYLSRDVLDFYLVGSVEKIRDEIGYFVSADIQIDNSLRFILGVIYLHPGHPRDRITNFLMRIFQLLNRMTVNERNTAKIMITGDFNSNIMADDWLITFMAQVYDLKYLPIYNKLPTTLNGTTIDLTFHKNLTVECLAYISYFSHHRPILNRIVD